MERMKNAIDWFKDGTALYTLKRYEKAIECYDKAIEQLDPDDPDNAGLWLAKAVACIHIPNRKEEFSEFIEKSIELDPKIVASFVKEATVGDTATGEAWMQVARLEEQAAAQQVFHIESFTGEIGRDKQVAGYDIVGGSKTGDVGMLRGGVGSAAKPFSNCPHCGEALNLTETPKFCPYCGGKLRSEKVVGFQKDYKEV